MQTVCISLVQTITYTTVSQNTQMARLTCASNSSHFSSNCLMLATWLATSDWVDDKRKLWTEHTCKCKIHSWQLEWFNWWQLCKNGGYLWIDCYRCKHEVIFNHIFVLIWARYLCNCAHTFKCDTPCLQQRHTWNWDVSFASCSVLAAISPSRAACSVVIWLLRSLAVAWMVMNIQVSKLYTNTYIYMVYTVVQEVRNVYIWGMSNTCVHCTTNIIVSHNICINVYLNYAIDQGQHIPLQV